jgi:hypothetical protein
LDPFPAPELSATTFVGGQLSFNLTGVTGYQYVIEASPDLIFWQPLQTNVAPFTFTTTNAAGYSQEYFRAAFIP